MTIAGSSSIARQARLPRGTHAAAPLVNALMQWQAAAVRQDEVDPLTTELVRLRCASHHDCHT
jgi:hypothetical protein